MNALALVILGAMPHLLVGLVLAGEVGVSAALLVTIAWNLVPVAIGALLVYVAPRAVGVAWLLSTTAASAVAAWWGAMSPPESVSLWTFVWLPVCNTILVGPAGVVLAAIAQRW